MNTPGEETRSRTWDLDPDVMLFSGRRPELPVGTAEPHGFLDIMEHLFGKSKEVVKANWIQVIDQMKYLIEHVDVLTDSYELSEVEFKLGFSAEGTIVFIAQAGIEATISATFRRKGSAATDNEKDDD